LALFAGVRYNPQTIRGEVRGEEAHMVRKIGRLTALFVSRIKEPGKYPDGGGLYLEVAKGGARSWTYRYMLRGAERWMGLGPLHAVPLTDARKKAAAARQLKHEGIDPISARHADAAKARLDAAKAITFKDAATAYIEAHKAGWSNLTHEKQWDSSLEAYVYPVFGSLSVQSVDVGLVLKAIEPIWAEKTETASRVRGRIENVLDWATARGYRTGDNPARWRGHLANLLPKKSRVRMVQHFPAIPYNEIGAFMETLRGQAGVAARALEFLILTVARTSEVIGAVWGEFDLDAGKWIIPAARIKSRREHRAPLSPAALAVLEEMRGGAEPAANDLVFPGRRIGRPLSGMAMLALMKRMGQGEHTVHGFRSTFRDWAAERTNYPREVAEMALAHVISDQVEAAYRRGDLFTKRQQMMDAWATFCAAPATSGEVVALRGQ